MTDLRELLTEIGFKDARSLLQSDNVVFGSDARVGSQLESVPKDAAKRRLGLDTDFFVRTAKKWKAIIAGNPFPDEAQNDPGHLIVMFLKNAPNREGVAALEEAITGREVVRVKGRHAYIIYPDGIGGSRLTNALIEKKLGTCGTGRNWNASSSLALSPKT
jgi:uncharacterized protein (DUF1697 family)